MEESISLDKQDDAALRYVIKQNLVAAFTTFYGHPSIRNSISSEHIGKTPQRVSESLFEMFKGCWENPEDHLSALFTEKDYDEILYVNDISFVSMCAHHNLPFFGKMHFGYLPDGKIVGLSKIPRMIHSFAHRPQVQEKLSHEIVSTFDRIMQPKGCGLVIEAYHLCMMIRGIESKPTYTKSTALRGLFKTSISTKQEFLDGVRKTTNQIWP